MKKFFALILVLCTCFTAVACSTSDSTDTTAGTHLADEPSSSPVPESTADSAPGGNTSLNVWAIESPYVTDYETNAQSLWMESETGVKINWMAVPQSGWYSAFQASVMADEDVHIYCYPFDTMEAEMLGSEMKCIIPLEDLISPENTPNIWAILEAEPELKSLITAPDGHIYTLFTNDVYNTAAYTQKLWINRYFLEKYTAETGKGIPETTVEFQEMLVYFNTHDMNGNGVQDEIPYMGQSGVEGMYHLFGSFIPSNSSSNGYGCYTNASGETEFAYVQDAFKSALSYVSSLYAQGLVSPDTFTISTDDLYTYTSGNVADVRVGVVAGAGIGNVVQLSSGENTMNYGDYVALPPMSGPEGVRTIMTAGESSVALRNAITTKCPDPVAAIQWLDAGYSETARMFTVYGGLEGTDWAYTEGETVTGNGRVITSLTESGENLSWNGQGIAPCVTEEDFLMMDVTQLNVNAELATYRANLAYRPYAVLNNWPSIVWVGERTEEASEYSELGGLVKNAVSEYFTDVILGRKNLTTDWDTYTQTLDEIGLDRFVELVKIYADSAQ